MLKKEIQIKKKISRQWGVGMVGGASAKKKSINLYFCSSDPAKLD